MNDPQDASAARYRIADIRGAAQRIAQIVGDGPDAFFEDSSMGMLRQEASRYLLITLGEAASALPESIKDQFPDWRFALGQRNLVAHEYWKVNNRIIWRTMANDVPAFVAGLELLDDQAF